jgi:membrane-associated HD superfamily phosphohydrolase
VNKVMNLLGSTNVGEFFDWLSDYQLLKDSVPWFSYIHSTVVTIALIIIFFLGRP